MQARMQRRREYLITMPEVPREDAKIFACATEFHTVTSDTEAELRQELEAVFGGAEFPVDGPMELIPALPDGPGTTFEAGDVSVTVMDLGMKYADYQDYPYETADELVDDLMHGFREEGLFE